jgi:hypothetical protein
VNAASLEFHKNSQISFKKPDFGTDNPRIWYSDFIVPFLSFAMQHVVIPCFEPEKIAADAGKRHGDHGKVATTSLRKLVVHGAELTSRYRKQHEYEAMVAMVEGVGDDLRQTVSALHCDSQADVYSVRLHPCTMAKATEIAKQIETASDRSRTSHNGIFVEGAFGVQIEIGPNYDFDLDLD